MPGASTLLIVDDEPVGRDTLEALLIREGYNLHFAGDGPETLAMAASLVPDLILLDIMMPGMDGYEVCRRLRADPKLADVPVIMVTALDDRDSRLRGIEAGADDFVSKPFDRAELRSRVRTITRLNRYRRLLMERAKFEWVVEQATDGYLLIDAYGQVLYANPQARLYLDLPRDPDQTIPEAFLALAGRQYHREPAAAWQDWPSGLASRPDQTDLLRYLVKPETPGAKAFWLQVDTRALPAGSGAGWLVRLTDVTEQLATQRDLRGFHSMITHKLRTPFSIVSNSLEVIARFGPRLSEQELIQTAKNGLQNAQLALRRIQDILGYLNASRPVEAGEGFQLAHLETVAKAISADLKITPAVVTCPDPLRRARLPLSRRAVEVIMWETLENAAKFHPQHNPSVEIQVSLTPAPHIRLRIQDDGVTLSPEQLAQLWVPYYQGEKHFTGQMPGMGLGLATVATLVWGVGGSCRAFNRSNQPGLVVELALPLHLWQSTGAREQTPSLRPAPGPPDGDVQS